MPRDGAIIFRDLVGKLEVLHLVCDKCGRHGRYRLDRLIEQYGIDAKLFDWSLRPTARARSRGTTTTRVVPGARICRRWCRGGVVTDEQKLRLLILVGALSRAQPINRTVNGLRALVDEIVAVPATAKAVTPAPQKPSARAKPGEGTAPHVKQGRGAAKTARGARRARAAP
jgi:hypothetical protein